MKAKNHAVLSRAVEEGVAVGWRQGFKHLESEPPGRDGEAVREALVREVLNAIGEVFDFEDAPAE